jgi:septum formation protein
MTSVILASTSAIRRSLLANAGVAFTSLDPGVDEGSVKTERLACGDGPREIAAYLAALKAKRVSEGADGLVIGADQTLDLEGVLFDKVIDLAAARERLLLLRGRAHRLYAGIAVARDGAVIWSDMVTATLTMRDYSDAFLDDYLSRCGQEALSSVGCYHLEGEGVQLFSAIEGDYFAILGLPLLNLLDLLRARGALAA